jgi:DNA-directed RNA polymerase subunit RPC12/RpoP
MYHQLPPYECSKCGSINCETFQQRHISGIRCLNCGHTQMTKNFNQEAITTNTVYVSDNTRTKF